MIVDGRTLVVVADGRRARVFEEARLDGPLHERAEWLTELPGPHEGGKGEPPGRVFDSHGHASHATHGETPHDKGEREFVAALAGQLDRIMLAHKIDDLILIAAPKALGQLRSALSKNAERKLKFSESHDRVSATADEIHQAVHALRRKNA